MKKRSPVVWLIIGIVLASSVFAAADIQLSMADSPDPVVKGQNLTYIITATNVGDAEAFNVTIVNVYDAGVAFDSATFGPNASNDTFVISNISAGLAFSFNITVNVSSGLFNGTVLTDSAVAFFNDTAGTQLNASQNASNTTTVLGFPTAATTKTANQSIVVKGTQLNYTIVVNNTGDDTMFNISVVDSYPSGVVFDSADPAPTGNDTWSFASLAPNATATVFIRVNVSSALGNGTVLNNSYTATFANVSGQNITVSNSTTTIVQGIPYVITNKTDSPDPVGRGNTLSYTITVNNTGDEIAYNVTVVETYPLSVTFNGSTPAPSAGNNTFNLGNLLPNGSTTINITVNVSSGVANGSVLNNSYNVMYTNLSGINATVENSTLTTVRGVAALMTNKTANETVVVKGTQLNYTIVVNNTGDDTAFNVTIVDTYPAGVVFDASTPAPTSGNNTFSFGDLAPNATATITIRVNVSAGLANGTILNNSYTATFANVSGQNTTVTNSTTTSVQGIPYLITNKTDSPDPVGKGNVLSYSIFINNTGDEVAYNVTVIETYPLGVTFNGSTPIPTSGNNTFNIGTLAPNQSTTINITVNVSNGVANGTVLNNSYNVTYANLSGINATVENSTLTTVRGVAALMTNKTANQSFVVKGTQLNYTIVVNNTGDDTAFNTTIIETYPEGVVFDASTPAPSAGNNTFSAGDIQPNATFTITIRVNVSASLTNGTILNNSYTATFANSSGQNTTVTNSTTTTVLGYPAAATSKSANQSIVVKGTQLNYTIVVNNTGDDTMFNISVVDGYPNGVVFDSASPAPTGNDTWSFASLAPNATATVFIRVNVSSALSNGTVLNNSYNVTFANVSGMNLTVSNSTTTTVQGIPYVITNKTDSPDPIVRGNTLSYTITVNNTGDEIAYNVTVVETYPLSVTFNGSTPAPSAGNNTFSLGNLLPNASTTINITVNVSSGAANGTVLNNTYDVMYTNLSGTNTTVQNSTATTVQGAPNLITNKTDTPDPVVRGHALNYTLLITNTGDEIAYNVTVVETYPANTAFGSSTPVPSAGNNTFSLGNLLPNASTTINITVNVNSTAANGSILNNSYNVTFANVSGVNATVQNSTTTTVQGIPNVITNKTDTPDPVGSGNTLSYTITVNNTGDEIAYNVTVVEAYPSSVTFNGSTPAPSAGNNTFSLGNLLPNASTTINITVNVSSGAANGSILNNSYNVTFANLTGTNATVTNSTFTTVRGLASLMTNKTANQSVVGKGTQLNYTIVVNNTGDDTAFNVTIVDTYPAGVVFDASTPAPSTGNSTFSAGDIQPNATFTITIRVNVSASLTNGTILNNSYTATFANSSGQNTTVTNSTTTTVLGYPSINTNKVDSQDPVVAGSTLNYTITITNNGDDTAFNVTVLESYPAGLTLNSSSPLPTSGNNSFTITSLAPGATTTINLTVTVGSNVANGTVLNNSYNVTFANVSGQTQITANSTTTTVLGVAGLTVTKTAAPSPVVQGAQVTYQITITNSGSDTAYNVTIVETYPNVSFINATPAPTSGNDTWLIGNLTPGQSTTINITVNTSNTFVGSLNNSVNATFANALGNTNSASTSQATQVNAPAATGGGGGGGGGTMSGGAALFSKTYDMNSDLLLTNQLRVADKVNFFINNVQHVLTITNLLSSQVTFSVASVSQSFSLTDQAYQLIDVEKDGKNDLRVDVARIQYPYVTLRLQKLSPSSAVAPKPTTTAQTPVVKQNETGAEQTAQGQETTRLAPPAFLTEQGTDRVAPKQATMKSKIAWFGAALALIAVLLLLVLGHRRKKRHAHHLAHHKRAHHAHSLPFTSTGDKSEREKEYDKISAHRKK